MPRLMDWIRHALGFDVTAPTEQVQVDKRLAAQKLRLDVLDRAIEAGTAATGPYRGPERRRFPRT